MFERIAQIDLSPLPRVDASATNAQKITNLVFGLVGSILTIVIIVLALRYMTSRGNVEATGKLRDGIIFAAIGIAIILMAAAIITFVQGKL